MGSNPRDGLRGLRRTLISPPDFRGGRGILYYGLFKPTDPYELTDGVWIVPSGWEMLSLPIGVVGRGTRSHFVVPDDWKVETAWQAFRDWVAFDSFYLCTTRLLTTTITYLAFKMLRIEWAMAR